MDIAGAGTQPALSTGAGDSPVGRRTGTRRLRTWWWNPSIAGVAPFLLGITLLGRAAQNTGQTTYPLVAHQLLGIGNGVLGIAAAASGIAGVVSATVLGTRITTRNALTALAVGQAAVLGAFVLLALPTGPVGLWLGALAIGAGGGIVFPATMTAIGAAPRSQRARALAVYALALSVGLVAGPLVESGALHLLSDSLRATFGAMVPLPLVATVVSAAAAWRSRTARGPACAAGDDRFAAAAARTGATPAPMAAGTATMTARPSASTVPWAGTDPAADPTADPAADPAAGPTAGPAAILAVAGGPATRPRPALLQLPAFRLALATMLTYQAPFIALVSFGALLARHADGAPAAGAELGFAAFFAVSFSVRAAVVLASPLRHRRAALAGSTAATAGGIALLAGGHGFGAYVAAMAVLGAPHGLTFPLATATLADGVNQADLGRANARLMAWTNGVSVLVPLVCGWIAAVAGYRAMFLAVEIPVGIFGAALSLELRRGATGTPAR